MYKFWQKTIHLLSILILIATFFLIIWLYKIGILNDQNLLKEFLQQQGSLGSLSYVLIQIIQVVFPIIPGGVTTVVGILVFGPLWGFVVNYIGIMSSFKLFRSFFLLFQVV